MQAILGPNNLAFKHGPPHKAIRKSFLALFTRKALGTYVQQQDSIIRRHLAQWGQCKEEREIRNLVRCADPAECCLSSYTPLRNNATRRACKLDRLYRPQTT